MDCGCSVVVGNRAVYAGRNDADVSLAVDMSIDGKDECREWGFWGGRSVPESVA